MVQSLNTENLTKQTRFHHDIRETIQISWAFLTTNCFWNSKKIINIYINLKLILNCVYINHPKFPL